MRHVDVHPEDLLDAAHAGRLDPGEQERLHVHAAHCGACALELRAMGDLAGDLGPQPGDDAMLERLVAQAMGGAPGEAAKPARTARPRMLYAVAAALGVGAIGGAALAMVALREPAPAAAPVVLPAAEPADHARPGTRAVAPAAVDEIEVAEESEVVEAAGEVPVPETPEPRAAQVRVPAPVPSAAELLAQANAARRDGDREGAARLYRRLQGLHPRSREAAISHVTLGRLLLDGMNDPQSSLREFDTYLGQTRHRVLEEEARVGRAMALSRLGRRDEERRAWRELLEHHPDTLYAERARARL